MVDSVLFYLSGDRVIDANGNVYSGATLKFELADSSHSLTVYTNKELTTPHSDPVETTSGGLVPDIWLGTADYKVTIKDSSGAVIPGYPRDNRKGALDTSVFDTTYALREEPAVSVTSTSYTLLSTNFGKVHDCNPSGGDIAFSLSDAVTAGDGAVVIIRHVGASGNVTISAPSSQLSPITLTRIGQSVTVDSNGATWRVSAEAVGLFINRTPIINLVDRLATPPSSPAAGARYLISGTPTGAWVSFAANDIVEYHTIAGWQRYTPAKGWLGYLEDDKFLVAYDGSAWVDWSNISAPSPSALKYAVFEDQKATNTAGGTSVSGGWLTATINTQVANTITGASLAANRITLAAGSYEWHSLKSFYANNDYIRTRAFRVKKSTTVTISNASPGVVTLAGHGLEVNDEVIFTTSGSLPTGLTAGVSYFVRTVLGTDTFTVSATEGGSDINTSSAGSGTHSVLAGVALATSPNMYCNATTVMLPSVVTGRFVLAASASIELQYRVTNGIVSGLGVANNVTGFVERYTQITITDLASIQGPQGAAGVDGDPMDLAAVKAATVLDGEEGACFDLVAQSAAIVDYAGTYSAGGRATTVGTYGRTSAAYGFARTRLSASFAAGSPRYEYAPTTGEPIGLLIEPAATNLCLQSLTHETTWTTASLSVTADNRADITGATVASKLVEGGAGDGTTTHYLQQTLIPCTSGTKYCISMEVEAAERTNIEIYASSTAFGVNAVTRFNLSAVTATISTAGTNHSAGIVALDATRFLCWCSLDATATTNATLRLRLHNGSTSSYTGDGTSGIYLGNVQFETGAIPTSRIITTTTSATRNADTFVKGLSLVPSVSSQFTLLWRGRVRNPLAAQTLVEIRDGTGVTNNGVRIKLTAAGAIEADVYSGGVLVKNFAPSGTVTAGTDFAACLAVRASDMVFDTSLGAAVTHSSGSPPSGMTTFTLGENSVANHRRVTLYTRRLPDATVATLAT